MPRLYSSREIEIVSKKFAYTFVSQKGSHGKFKNAKGDIVILPMKKREIPIGTFRSNLRQMNITQEDFIKSLK